MFGVIFSLLDLDTDPQHWTKKCNFCQFHGFVSGSNLPKRTHPWDANQCGKFLLSFYRNLLIIKAKFGPHLTLFITGAGWTARRAGVRREGAGPVSTAPLLSPALCVPMWGALTPTSSDTGGPVILSSSTPAPIATSGTGYNTSSVDPKPLAFQKKRQPVAVNRYRLLENHLILLRRYRYRTCCCR